MIEFLQRNLCLNFRVVLAICNMYIPNNANLYVSENDLQCLDNAKMYRTEQKFNLDLSIQAHRHYII